MTFNSLIDIYLDDMSHQLRESTMDNKRNIMNKKIRPFIGETKLSKLNERTIRKWQNDILSLKDNKGNPYSQTYIKTINNQMSAILNYAVKYYGLKSNPIHTIGSIGKKHADEKNNWSLEQFNKAMAYYEFRDAQTSYTFSTIQYKFAFNLLFYTGVRIGELLALTANDFDYTNRILKINKFYQRIHGKDIVSRPKTDTSIRNITIPDFLFDMLDEYLDVLYDYQPHERIFPQVKKYSLAKQLQMISKHTDLPRIRVHDLRHSHASLLIKQGVNFKVIQQRLGHKDIQTTLNTYSHLWSSAHQEVAELLNGIRVKNKTA
ncbi:tyrosine-type recombinase/integrase [Aerococcus viridans]|nr:tyrosine-type recombinase/integrase [Aerococcus viridans]